jgi:ligand-binding sensor domain-containing protein
MKTIINLIIGMFLVQAAIIGHAQTFKNYTTTDGLPDNNVNGVAVDRHNNKWFATQSGVAKFNDTIWTVYKKTEGVIDNDISCIAIDSSGNIWAGTAFGVSKFDGTGWTSYTADSGLINNTVTCITVAPDGSVWFGTGSGLSHLTGSAWTNYDSLPGNNNAVSCMAFETGGRLWIGTWLGGAVTFNGSVFSHVICDSLVSTSITSVAIDKDNNKWLGTYSSGITVLDNSDQWKLNYRSKDGLYNNYIQDIKVDPKNTVWIGMYADYIQEGGITKFDGTTWTSYTVADGLVNQLVRRLGVDLKNNIWIGTGSGVSKFTDKTSGIRNISASPVTVFPNPASGAITVSNVPHTMLLTISDLAGRKMMTQTLADHSNSIDISRLKPGMYIVVLADEGALYSSRLIVQ